MNAVDGATPYYVQVAETLKRRILAGEYPENTLLPNGDALEKEFGVSDITIRKALAELADAGMVRRKRGLGAVVVKCQRDVFSLGVSGNFHHLIRLLDQSLLEVQCLDAEVVPCPNRVAQAMGFAPGDPVSRIRRVRKCEGRPIAYYVHYCALRGCRPLTREDVADGEFLAMLRRVTGESIDIAKQRLEAICADCDLGPALEVKFGTPLLFIETLFFFRSGPPVAITHSYYRGDVCCFVADMTDIGKETPEFQLVGSRDSRLIIGEAQS